MTATCNKAFPLVESASNNVLNAQRKDNIFAITDVWDSLTNSLFQAPFSSRRCYLTITRHMSVQAVTEPKRPVFCIRGEHLLQYLLTQLRELGWSNSEKQNAKKIINVLVNSEIIKIYDNNQNEGSDRDNNNSDNSRNRLIRGKSRDEQLSHFHPRYLYVLTESFIQTKSEDNTVSIPSKFYNNKHSNHDDSNSDNEEEIQEISSTNLRIQRLNKVRTNYNELSDTEITKALTDVKKSMIKSKSMIKHQHLNKKTIQRSTTFHLDNTKNEVIDIDDDNNNDALLITKSHSLPIFCIAELKSSPLYNKAVSNC
eukprot:Pgem_evm1s4055